MCRTVVMYTFVIFSVLYQARPRVMITAGTITNSSLTMIYSNFTTRIMHSYLISMIIGRDSPIFPDQYTLLKNNETSSICNYHYLTTHCRRQISSQHVLASRRGRGFSRRHYCFTTIANPVCNDVQSYGLKCNMRCSIKSKADYRCLSP